jgi:hypothetical protein
MDGSAFSKDPRVGEIGREDTPAEPQNGFRVWIRKKRLGTWSALLLAAFLVAVLPGHAGATAPQIGEKVE